MIQNLNVLQASINSPDDASPEINDPSFLDVEKLDWLDQLRTVFNRIRFIF